MLRLCFRRVLGIRAQVLLDPELPSTTPAERALGAEERLFLVGELSSTEASVRTARSVCVELSCGGTSPVEAVSARVFGDTAACVVFVEASAVSSRAIEANASGRSSCSRSSRLSGLRLCRVLPRE